jgi:hypothetical protein
MPNASRKIADAPTLDPVARVRASADAMYRSALECCRQHDRIAKLVADEPDVERKHLEAMCHMCDGSLTELADAYRTAAGEVGTATDEDWWHRANALWHASREYERRHAGCDALVKSLSARHSAQKLAGMQMEYELEASALLALRHAAEAYQKTRPGLH